MSRVSILTFAAPAAALLLAGCGGGGGGSSDRLALFNSYVEQGEAFDDRIEDLPYTDPSTLPTTGAATYNGVMGAELQGGLTVAGAMELTTNFVSNEVSGSVDDITDSNGDDYEGDLTIANGTIDRTADPDSEFSFDADLVGNIEGPDGTATVVAGMDGDFYGSDYSLVGGVVRGSVVSGGQVAAITEGAFAGER